MILVDSAELDWHEIERVRKLCADSFGQPSIDLYATEATSKAFPDLVVWSAEAASSDLNAMVLVSHNGWSSISVSGAAAKVPRYHINPGAKNRRYRLTNDRGEMEYGFNDIHVFNRIAYNRPRGYVYFPYGFQYRLAGHGPLDPFSFRINCDINDLIKRDKKHIVVAAFGGSTTFSIDCLFHEAWPQRLEYLLNDRVSRQLNLQFTCLNFGQSAATVMSEMEYFITHCHRLRPDIVIAHDAWNDLLYGSYTDPFLIRERDIVYPCDLEPWAQAIHGTAHIETTKTRMLPFPVRSAPSTVISAYVERKAQFQRIVEAHNGTFIWGQQPCIRDKADLNSIEWDYIHMALEDKNDDWARVRIGVPGLLRTTAKSLAASGQSLVDLSEDFADLSPEVQHFTDNIHLTPAGDDVVAHRYCAEVLKLFQGRT